MPVPVPLAAKAAAHPVHKYIQSGDVTKTKPSVFHRITHSLPVPPIGPPPSFGTREEWINSLPSWRRSKRRQIWQNAHHSARDIPTSHFCQGLAGADNALPIKGAHVEACIPPARTFLRNRSLGSISPSSSLPQEAEGDMDEDMDFSHSIDDQFIYDHESQWSASSPLEGNENDLEMESPDLDGCMWPPRDGSRYDERLGVFSPVLEEESPDMVDIGDAGSSPIGPLTPFGEYIDRAVAATQTYASVDPIRAAPVESLYAYTNVCGPQCYQCQPYTHVESTKAIEEPTSPTTASMPYRKLAEPLAQWIVAYVWKVCTTGTGQAPGFAVYMPTTTNPYSAAPPAGLVESVHSLFLSTLLQPSAVLLAVWYIARLPVYFGAVGLGPEHVKELRFRAELLEDTRNGTDDRTAVERNILFRLILLGCMLANKWLDDHTFSNKTWHSISNVPIQSLNKLESLALDIFTHDLSVTPVAWSEWLAHLMSYHRSVACPHPQPISRPSASPHSVIRKVIEEIAEAPASLNHIDLQPVFLGLEQRRKEKFGCDKASSGHSVDVYEIDLDEDGPLREEYLPRRRAHRNMDQRIVPGLHFEHTEKRLDGTYNMDRAVPPPAKWSPAGDEPIMRERNRASGQYVAVQPSLAPQYAIPVPASYDWTSGVAYVPVKPPPMMTGYGFDVGPFPHALSQYVPPYPCDASAVLAHSRSQSQCCYDQDNSQARGHVRSQSYSQYNYRGGNMHLTTNEVGQPSQVDSWPTSNHYGYSASAYRHLFRPHPSVNHQSIWLRAC